MNVKHSDDIGSTSRRGFLAASAGTVLGLGAAAVATLPVASAAEAASKASATGGKRIHRVGTATISFRYAVKSWQQEGFAAMKFLEASARAGAEVVMLYDFLIDKLDSAQLKQLRARAEELNVALDASGQDLFRRTYEHTMEIASALGVKAIGAYSGMLLRPDKIATLDLWDQHQARTEARLRELAPAAKRLGMTVALENHLDFTTEELCGLMRRVASPHIGVLFDVGNSIATLDDPLETADALAPYTVATHFKDFAVEEVARGFLFTMVPLGAGSLQLHAIAKRLLAKVRPEANFCIEMMNGQQFEVKWLEDRFWVPYRGVSARQVAATLRHIRGKAIDISRFVPEKELDVTPHQQHVQFEFDKIKECMAYLKNVLDTLAAAPQT